MEKLQEMNQNLPCDKRVGYGTTGCSCDGSLKENRDKVKCGYYNQDVRWDRCINCNHQILYIRMIQSRKNNA